ncbi:thiopeptide-type bacteriocin biosynthesis protein [Streptomyces sp. NBC_01244]|uniref:thiopeptide-type bacteriocin biosynthesis protein n=1 Tax=Streptomyces sp. NBC_01244 TaxID=2903797 RepID=UPI002E0D6FAA|nr:thiopeptide-type bacteriocin biosynthesis protein [Streptomyces sp. NBC_01244]
MTTLHVPEQTERAVLAVLAGQSVAAAAIHAGIDAEELGDATALYRAAGQAALAEQVASRDWHQSRVEFADFDRAEDIAAHHLAPRLRPLEDSGLLAAWWFIRKAPCWRLRLLPAAGADPGHLHEALSEVLGSLVQSAEVLRWWPTVYEPEVTAFGGREGIDIAHGLFHADSRHFLERTHHVPGLGRRETSLLLVTAMLRSAGLDWFEQGDVWDRVSRLRPLPGDVTPGNLAQTARGVHRLLSLDTRPLTAGGGAMEAIAPWLAAFEAAGQGIAHAAQSGNLQRGPRRVLTHHVIFHWNRHGLSARTQGVLAHAARAAILAPTATS